MDNEETLELQIPSEPEFLGTARLFLTAAGRHFELSEETMADLKMAVSEVCAGAIEDPHRPVVLLIAVSPDAEALEVDVLPGGAGIENEALPGPDSSVAAPTFEQRLRGPLVHALFPDADYEPQHHRLRVSVPWEVSETSDDG